MLETGRCTVLAPQSQSRNKPCNTYAVYKLKSFDQLGRPKHWTTPLTNRDLNSFNQSMKNIKSTHVHFTLLHDLQSMMTIDKPFLK